MTRKNTFIAAILFLAASQTFGGTVPSCAQYQGVTVGNYIVQTDYWNMGQCPGTQCMDIDDKTGSFTVTKDTFNCVNSIAAYPSVLYGKAFGSLSPNCDLPAPLSSLKCAESSWTFKPTYTGRWDAAYDIWLCPDNQCGSGGFNGGAEIMIWLDYWNTNGWQHDMGQATIGGRNWEVWWWDVRDSAGKRNYVAYLAKDKTDSVKNLDIKKFLDDARVRGYVQSSWYLYAVLAGVELGSAGTPFTNESFSVSVNKNCGAEPVYAPAPATPTPVPYLSPDEIPPPP